MNYVGVNYNTAMGLLKKLVLITIGAIFFTCSSDEDLSVVDPLDTQLSFQIQRFNSGDDFRSSAIQTTFSGKNSWWWEDTDGRITVRRNVIFDVKLAQGEIIEVGFSLTKDGLTRDQLVLEDGENIYGERAWEFKTFEDKANHFYKTLDGATTFVTPYNVIFHSKSRHDFVVTNVERVIVNGEEKSVITIRFNGNAFGWYDPTGEYSTWYKISGGHFRGIIE